MTFVVSECSSAIRKKVGALIVKNGRVLSIGYNGTFPGDNNECEYKIRDHFEPSEKILNDGKDYQLRTKPSVLHAEFNAISKMARDGDSAIDATLFVTLSPCVECAKLIINVGIKHVFYAESYNNLEGIVLLRTHGVVVEKFSVQTV